jgi:hypothetical protein
MKTVSLAGNPKVRYDMVKASGFVSPVNAGKITADPFEYKLAVKSFV